MIIDGEKSKIKFILKKREGTEVYPIIRKEELNETTTLMEVEAPLVAAKAKPGQFIIFRIDEEGERVPLTIQGITGKRELSRSFFNGSDIRRKS